jgi:hypothetical protein
VCGSLLVRGHFRAGVHPGPGTDNRLPPAEREQFQSGLSGDDGWCGAAVTTRGNTRHAAKPPRAYALNLLQASTIGIAVRNPALNRGRVNCQPVRVCRCFCNVAATCARLLMNEWVLVFGPVSGQRALNGVVDLVEEERAG